MQTTQAETHGDLMAIWLATGGAVDMVARPESAGDDGLQAGIPTMNPPFCISDDGLQAGRNTYYPCVDDGLQAGAITLFYGPCISDEGLQATAPSMNPPICIGDGL